MRGRTITPTALMLHVAGTWLFLLACSDAISPWAWRRRR
jgi:hypothetical protein